MAKNLVIVESPAKAKTIEKYLGKDFKVMSSYGHIRDLPKKDAIDIENGFEPRYEVPSDKKKLVADLRRNSKSAQKVWLASDEDREGEAIAWHLYDELKLTDENTERIVFHEITKGAILKAIENPRKVDLKLKDAQQARRVLDRLVGFELSPVLWRKIKGGLSAGRVQSVSVRLVVEKEREIQAHQSKSTYKVVGEFINENNIGFKADLRKNFSTKQEALDFLNDCNGSEYQITALEKKPAKRSPAAPFTTSTLQQEASRKLGFSVGQTMQVAQKLYESGAITYMRTDSVNLSQDALSAIKAEIEDAYGQDYHKHRTYSSKTKGAQEAHEAIRPTNMVNHNGNGDYNATRLYQLIWKRTIASQMADAQIERTTAEISISKNDNKFVAKGEVIKFEGFIKAYLEGTDDEDVEEKNALPALNNNEILSAKAISATERFSRPPARFTEASLVKKLEELGIGRPSTYAPTISTIQKRGYVEKSQLDGKEREYQKLVLSNGDIKDSTMTEITGADKNKMLPTDIGMVVNDYLVEHFEQILDYNFTAQVETKFDEIAEGQEAWNKIIAEFYGDFHTKVEEAAEGERASGERELGIDPESGDDDKKPKFASIPKSTRLESITLQEALDLFQLPKTLGQFKGEDAIVSQGRFGPYVKYGDMFVSLDKGEDPMSVDLNRATELIEAKIKADAPIAEYENKPVQKGVGRFGPFIKWNSIFINVNKKYDFDNLSQADIVKLIEDKKQKEIEKVIHNWEDEGIRVEKARWGRFNVLKGKFKLELPKTTDALAMTLDEVKALIEKNAPKKKKAVKRKPAAKKKK
jgi:DNA topoisomerase-1